MIAKCVQINTRLYSPEDDDLLRWYAEQSDQYGNRTHALKQAWRRGIEIGGCAASPAPILDLAEMRTVVEAAVTTALGRFDVVAANGGAGDEDEETEQLLSNLGNALTLEEQ